MKKRKPRYREQAQKLRALGYHVKFGQRGTKSIPQHKAAVSRLFGRVSRYVRESDYKFVRTANNDLMKQVKGPMKTPAGFFWRGPKGVPPSAVSVRTEGNVLIERIYDRRTGLDRIDRILTIDAERLVTESGSYIEGEIKKYRGFGHRQAKIMVKGHEGERDYDLRQMSNYMESFAYEKMVEPKNGQKPMTRKEFEATFTLKLIGVNTPQKPETKRKKRKNTR